jgi:hypothetical protein
MIFETQCWKEEIDLLKRIRRATTDICRPSAITGQLPVAHRIGIMNWTKGSHISRAMANNGPVADAYECMLRQRLEEVEYRPWSSQELERLSQLLPRHGS